jgi:hypothetical protein
MTATPPLAIPRTEEEIRTLARERDLPIPDACMPGVVSNMALLARHAAILRGEPNP